MDKHLEMVPVEDIYIDPAFWGEPAVEAVRQFLRDEYDPKRMPPLELNRREDGTMSLLGWDMDSPHAYETLLQTVMGGEYMTHRVDQVEAGLKAGDYKEI